MPVALLLLIAVLASALPLSTVASGPTCTLTCCEGRAPHAAGSCMNGSCQAVIAGPIKRVHLHEAAPQQTEQLCGLPVLKGKTARVRPIQSLITRPFASTSRSLGTGHGALDQASVSTNAFTKPCQPDCGSCASGFMNSNRQRNSAAVAYADRPRPPSAAGLRNFKFGLTQALSAMLRQAAPRGPPPFFS
jgi:hypothetical protein